MIALGNDRPFQMVRRELGHLLLGATEVKNPTWHSEDISDKDYLVSKEIRNVVFGCPLPNGAEELADITEPNMPWAETHFQERVNGQPLNPPPSAEEWGAAVPGAADKHRTIEESGQMKYSHSYPERFWPKHAGEHHFRDDDGVLHEGVRPHLLGIRFPYGDLDDVVDQLIANPLTRQAYLPVWFPEDTGAVHGERVPCTLGYHFLIRESNLHITYMIRSVDFVRHFADDVFLAGRLAQWMREEVNRRGEYQFPVGSLTMHIMSLHCFRGDQHYMEENYGPSK